MKIWLEKIHLDLKVNWKLSRNQTTFKENFIVNLQIDNITYLSEIAPNIRYGETADKIEAQFASWLSQTDIKKLKTDEDLGSALDQMPLFHSLRFGIESVFIKYFALYAGTTLQKYLNLPAMVPVKTSFSMPIIPVGEIKDYLAPICRFDSLKIKVDAEVGKDMLAEIKKHTNVKLRVDANEGWKDLDDFVRFQEGLKGMNIEVIEQPFASTMVAEYKALKKITPYKLLADESIEDAGNFQDLSEQFHAINVKLMKTGSLLKAKKLIEEGKKHNMTAMIGCMIETTIGISYGMLFGGLVEYVDLDGFLLIKDEPFRLVSETEGTLKLI